jgi:dephospho-CoA kinase
MNLQLPDSAKIKHADFIIENNSTKIELFKEVDKMIAKISSE